MVLNIGQESESEKNEKVINIPKEFYESEMHKIKSNPREYICSWMEENLMHVGKKAFRIISLMPVSTIIPSIPFQSSDIRSNINLFILGSPASGKSSLCKRFCNITYHPIFQKGISSKGLLSKIKDFNGFFSLAIDDFSNILDQADGYETVKILESAIGEEKLASHENMRYSINVSTSASLLLCGTWTDLKKYSNYLKGGLLSRTSLLFISLSKKQREDIADFMASKTGKRESSEESKIKETIIRDYYKILFEIQAKRNKSIEQINGYEFDENYKKMALSTWKRLTEDYANDINGDFKREFQDFFRICVNSAFLNIFNRKVTNGILKPEKEDYDFSLELMKECLENKIALIQSKIFLKELDSPQKLLSVIRNPNLKEDTRNILINLSPYKHVLIKNHKQ